MRRAVATRYAAGRPGHACGMPSSDPHDDPARDDSAGSDPCQPTVDEVHARQADEFPEQARTATHRRPATPAELAAIEAGGEPIADADDLLIEGPNSA